MQQQFLALLVLAEIAGEAGQLPAIQLDDAGTDAIEEGTVVGDEEQRDAAFDEQRFQPLDGGDVEMVGRLVEEQHVGRRRQGAGKREALLLAAGKGADAGLRIEAEAVDDLFRLRLAGPRTARLELVLEGLQARQQRVVLTLAVGHPVRDLVILGEQSRGFAHAGNHRVEYGQPRIEGRFLRHMADADARLHPHFAVVQPAASGTAGQRRQQRGLAGTVAADQRDALARVELEVGVVEHRHVAPGQAGIGEFQIGHGSRARPGAALGKATFYPLASLETPTPVQTHAMLEKTHPTRNHPSAGTMRACRLCLHS